jgi:prepilin-type N-terminal cleavage/methylation domain-containing protein
MPTPKAFTLVEIMIVVAIVGIVVSIAVPSFLRTRERTRMRACQVNLSQLDGAKSQWLLETKKKATETPLWDDLVGQTKFIRLTPQCPSLGTYTLGAGNELPICTLGTDEQFPHVFGDSES